MSELMSWSDLVEEIFDRGALYDSQRDGPQRGLTLSRTKAGIWTAQWTSGLQTDDHWTQRMHGHDKEHALSGLVRRLTDESATDSGKYRAIK